MMRQRLVPAAALLMAFYAGGSARAEPFFAESRSADSISRHALLELSFSHDGNYENKFHDVSLDAVFTSPSGTRRRVKGFYYGGDQWKVRFRPDEPGRWAYTYVMVGRDGFQRQGDGTFISTPGDEAGPVRLNPRNPFRWVFANGSPYFPVGLQDCFNARGDRLSDRTIDGGEGREGGRRISPDEYFSTYGRAGFNLLRFSQRNCSYSLFDDLDRYRRRESEATDELLSLARKNGFRVMFGFFGAHGNWGAEDRFRRVLRRWIERAVGGRAEAILTPEDRETVAKEQRFIDYAVARWGVYVDFWELLNERKALDEWTTMMAEYVRSIDPDGKPITTSWEKPRLRAIDINAPHWYESESESLSDLRVHELASEWKEAGKPVIVGEQGNTGMNWDPRSGLRMRIRAWTAMFEEITLVFWNTSWSKAGVYYGRYRAGAVANIYLGPEERGYIRVLQEFSSRLDPDVRMVAVKTSSPARVRAYGLASGSVVGAYLHHFEDHVSAVEGVKIALDVPATGGSSEALVGEWIDPATGDVLARVEISPGRRTLDVPPFRVDLALLISSPPKGGRP